MVLTGLKDLYRSMKAKKLSRVRFQYVHGPVTFDVFFFIDETPFCLMFGAVNFNVAFELAVKAGFEVEPIILPDRYKALCKALGLRFDPNNPFSVRSFLELFNQSIPQVAPDIPVRPEDVAEYRRDVEESDKIYFLNWRDNTPMGKRVTQDNLFKTKRILGHETYLACLKRNISSCWTDDRSSRRDPPSLIVAS